MGSWTNSERIVEVLFDNITEECFAKLGGFQHVVYAQWQPSVMHRYGYAVSLQYRQLPLVISSVNQRCK